MSVTTGSLGSINEIQTEVKLQKIFEDEEGDMIVLEFCKDLMNNVMDEIQSKTLTDLAQNFVVKCAIEAMKKAIRINYCFHNVSHSDMGDETWKPDEPCEASQADSWAAYRVPVTYDRESDDHIKNLKKEDSEVVEVVEKEQSKSNFLEICAPRKSTISPSTSSQDLMSIIDYLEDILSTSSSEEMNASSIMDMFPMDRLSEQSSKFSAKLSAKLSQLSGRVAHSESIVQPKSSERERYMTSAFSTTALGYDTGLCVPYVANQPANNAVIENPDIEEYTLVRVEKKRTKVMRKSPANNLPRRRSDTKLKMANVMEQQSKEKLREKKPQM